MSTTEANMATIEIGPLKISFPLDMPEHLGADLLPAKTPAFGVDLGRGEIYAGIVLGKNGEPDYRLILLPGEVEGVDWKSAQEWAEKCGGFLPTRREQSILFGNLKEKFKEAVYWSGERHESNSGWAWSQNFGYGDQYDDGQSRRFRARAVRRLSI